MTTSRLALSSAAVLLGLVGGAAVLFPSVSHGGTQPGDVTEGKAVFFNRCSNCHEAPSTVGLTEDELARNAVGQPKIGPSLLELFGRKAGSLPNYQYSDAMKAADLIWTEDTLQSYLLNPRAFIPNNKMLFTGIKREGEMEDLITYLKEATKQVPQ